MPTAPHTPCRTCRTLGPWRTTPPGRGYCPTCQTAADHQRNTSRRNRYGHTYRTERARILEGNPPCWWCGAPATTADHLHPASQGGNIIGNLVPACAHCNYSRQDRPTPPQPAPKF